MLRRTRPIGLTCLGVLLGALALLAPVVSADTVAEVMRHCPATSPGFETVLGTLRGLQGNPRVSLERIGQSRQGRPLVLVSVRDPEVAAEETVRVMVLARQHGTEASGTTAGLSLIKHFATSEGELERALLRQITWLVVPVVNPDGMASGRRANAAGVDLNRDWQAQSQPETRAVRAAVQRHQPHALIDMHELPASSGKAAFRDNFIQTIGSDRRLPTYMAVDCGRTSQSLAGWMKQRGFPLAVYYDAAGESLALCHRFFALAQGIPSYLFEAKNGPGRTLHSRTRFHVLGALVVANYALHRYYAPAGEREQVARAEVTCQPAPEPATAPPPPEPAWRLVTPEDGQVARGSLAISVEGELPPEFGYVLLQLNGVTRALATNLPQSLTVDTRSLADGEHRVQVLACDPQGRVLQQVESLIIVDNQRLAGE
jgi:hypothetical protein